MRCMKRCENGRLYRRKNMGKDMGKRTEKQKARDEIISGLSMTAVFAGLYFTIGRHFFWIFPFVFAGLVPLVKGITRYVDSRQKEGPDTKKISSKKDAEKAILKIAYQNKGVLTPSLLAVESSLTLEESEKYLEDLAGRGHAVMNVRENGGIEYIFNDLLPE